MHEQVDSEAAEEIGGREQEECARRREAEDRLVLPDRHAGLRAPHVENCTTYSYSTCILYYCTFWPRRQLSVSQYVNKCTVLVGVRFT